MAINFKSFVNGIPWRSPVDVQPTANTIEKRKTLETIRQQINAINNEEDLKNDYEKIVEQENRRLKLRNQGNELFQEIQQEELAAAAAENEKRQVQNTMISTAIATGLGIALQVSRSQISTIGLRTGNVIKQERLQRQLSIASQISGVAIGFFTNPIIGASAATAFATNLVLREYQTSIQRERVTQDNALRLDLLGGISQRGNR